MIVRFVTFLLSISSFLLTVKSFGLREVATCSNSCGSVTINQSTRFALEIGQMRAYEIMTPNFLKLKWAKDWSYDIGFPPRFFLSNTTDVAIFVPIGDGYYSKTITALAAKSGSILWTFTFPNSEFTGNYWSGPQVSITTIAVNENAVVFVGGIIEVTTRICGDCSAQKMIISKICAVNLLTGTLTWCYVGPWDLRSNSGNVFGSHPSVALFGAAIFAGFRPYSFSCFCPTTNYYNSGSVAAFSSATGTVLWKYVPSASEGVLMSFSVNQEYLFVATLSATSANIICGFENAIVALDSETGSSVWIYSIKVKNLYFVPDVNVICNGIGNTISCINAVSGMLLSSIELPFGFSALPDYGVREKALMFVFPSGIFFGVDVLSGQTLWSYSLWVSSSNRYWHTSGDILVSFSCDWKNIQGDNTVVFRDFSLCPSGYSCSSLGVSVPCQQGQFSSKGQRECSLCPPGTWSQAFAATNNATCKLCSPGFYSGAGSTQCSPCPINSYSSEAGSITCTPCPSGTSNSIIGSNQFKSCKSALSSGSILPTTDKCHDLVSFSNYDAVGNILMSSTALSLSACKALCCSNTACVGFSFITLPIEDAPCLLLRNVSSLVPSNYVSSAVNGSLLGL